MAGIDAFGTILARGDGGAPETFIAIANALNPSSPSLSRETHDVTTHESPEQWREFVGGLKDGGEVSCDVNFDPVQHVPLFTADLNTPDPVNYRLTWPDGSRVDFAAILTGLENENPHDGKMEASLTWKVSGKPTYTPGA